MCLSDKKKGYNKTERRRAEETWLETWDLFIHCRLTPETKRETMETNVKALKNYLLIKTQKSSHDRFVFRDTFPQMLFLVFFNRSFPQCYYFSPGSHTYFHV